MKKTHIAAIISIAMIFCMLAGFAPIPVAGDGGYPEYFITAADPNHWGRSDLRAYLNGTEKRGNTLPLDTSHEEREEMEYYESQFSDEEYEIVLPYAYSNNLIDEGGVLGGVYVTTDRFWLPSANFRDPDELLYWGGDDISSDALANSADLGRMIPRAYWAGGLDAWVRGDYYAAGDKGMVASRGTYVISKYIDFNNGVAAAFKIDIDSVSFAAMASASDIVAAYGVKKYSILGSNDFGKKTANALPDYGMYLKTLDEDDSFDPTGVTFDGSNLTVRYSGGAEGKYVVVQAYRGDSLEQGTTVYAAAQRISVPDSAVSFDVSAWRLPSLDGYTVKIWMEDASNGPSLAPATVPVTFFGSGEHIVKDNGSAEDNLRVFAMKEELQTSWGELKQIDDVVGENPTNQKIYLGVDQNGAPLQFWIAGRETYSPGKSPEDGDGTLSADGDVMTLYQAKLTESKKYNGSLSGYDEDGETVTIILEPGQRRTKYPLDKITVQTTGGTTIDKSRLSWEYRQNGGLWKSGMPGKAGEYEIRCYAKGTANYETTYSAPVSFTYIYTPSYRKTNFQAQEVLRGKPLSEVSVLDYDLGLPKAGGEDIIGTWEWVTPSQSVGDVGEKTFSARFIQTGPGEFDWSAYEGGYLQIDLPVRVMPTPINIGSVELSANKFEYSGAEQVPVLTVKDNNGQPLDLDTYFDITRPDDSVSAGQKQIVINFKENYTNHSDSACVLPMTLSYTVDPITLSIGELSVSNKTYDGTDAATVEKIEILGEVNSEVLAPGTDYTVTEVKFENASAGNGKKVYVTVALTSSDKAKNYTFAEGTSITVEATADIGKAVPNASALKPTPTLSAKYGQTLGDIKAELAGAIGAYLGANGKELSGTWGFESGDTVSVGNAGEITFYAVFTPDDTANYDWSAVQKISVKVNVDPATLRVEELSVSNKTYDGTDAATVEKIEISGEVNSEVLELGTDYTVTEVKFENASAGNGKKVYVTVALTSSDKTKNYTFAEGRSITVEATADIGKAVPNASALKPTPTLSAKYGQTLGDIKAELAGAIGAYLGANGEALSGTWSFESDDTASVGNVGENTFYAVFTPDDTDNYDWSECEKISVKITVSPITLSIGELSVSNKTYDGTDTGEVGKIEISGAVNSEVLEPGTDYTVTDVKFENASAGKGKKVFVTVALTSSDKAKNYTFAEGTSITVEVTADIGKAVPNASALKPTPTLSAKYGQTLGDIKAELAGAIGAYLGANGEALSGTWSFESGDSASVGNAGENTFYAVFTPDDTDNYDWSAVQKISVKITVSPITLSIGELSVSNKTYDGTDTGEVGKIEISGAVNSEVLELGTDYTVTEVKFENASPGNAKKVSVTVALTSSDKAKNYTFAEGTSITVEVTADIGKAVPNASALKPTPTLSAKYGQTLGDIKVGLSDAIGAYLGANGEALSGTWSFESGDTASVGNVGENTFYAVFTPDDTDNYDWSECEKISVKVTVSAPETTADISGDNAGEPGDKNNTLGTGEIVAIAVAAVAVVGLGGFALVWFVIKKKTLSDLVEIFKK